MTYFNTKIFPSEGRFLAFWYKPHFFQKAQNIGQYLFYDIIISNFQIHVYVSKHFSNILLKSLHPH